jgi:hypothetical protein
MKTRLLLASLAAGVVFGCLQQSSAQLEPYRQAQATPNPEADAPPPVARARPEAGTDRACPGAGATAAGTFREKGRT